MEILSIPLWRKIQRENFTNIERLCFFLELNEAQIQCIEKKPSFSLQVPRRLAQKMEKGKIDDPIFLQFIPLIREQSLENFQQDPVEDFRFCKAPKLLKKYYGRALLLPTSACAMHCRYCFRQYFKYSNTNDFHKELDILREDSLCSEIILSGGDPLSLSNESLEDLIRSLEEIPHLRRLRFHTRFPIGIPERIDVGFLKILEKTRFQIWFVIHCNHPKEMDGEVLSALSKIRSRGIPILNQSVLLKGVNDRLKVLEELSLLLTDNGILPYYLHQLDRVNGAEAFEVDEAEGRSLIQQLSEKMSGYGVPKYVKEVAGKASKISIVNSG
jgi:EF-P beta-lysylation protein EpmB